MPIRFGILDCLKQCCLHIRFYGIIFLMSDCGKYYEFDGRGLNSRSCTWIFLFENVYALYYVLKMMKKTYGLSNTFLKQECGWIHLTLRQTFSNNTVI